MSARIGAAHEPEQPEEARDLSADDHRPVLDDDSPIAISDADTPVTALAEPEPLELEVAEDASVEPSGSTMIVFEDVRKVYEPGVVALDRVSFTIDKGEFVFVVGASGSGKSTVVRLILKELEPSAGRIIVGGRDLVRLKRSKVPLLRRNVGCVFQDFKLLPNRTASENIAYALRVQGESSAQIRKKVPEVLNMVGLAHKMGSRPEELSGGEQQRVSIARAFVNHPPLLVGRDHAALVPDQPYGHDDPHGHSRPRDGRQDAQARDRAGRRPTRQRRAARWVRIRMTRARLLLSEALRSIGANKSTTLAAVVTVLVGMFLLGVFIGLGTWLVSWSDAKKKELAVHVYFCTQGSPSCAGDPTSKQINAVREFLESDARVKPGGITFITKADALEIMRKRSPELVENVVSNPLPASFDVVPTRGEDTEAIAVAVEKANLAGVDEVKYGKEVSRRVLQVARGIQVVFLIAIIILLVASTIDIANTIRLSIFARRREVEVMKLVGATNWFVRGPFMLEGVLTGVVGSLAAVLLLFVGREVAVPAILPNDRTNADVQALPFMWTALILFVVGLGIGALGSGLTLRRFLRV
jgi:ABC-type ATPase involved in cell division/cell division protein FtsX